MVAPLPVPFGVPFRLAIVMPSMVWPSVWLQVVVGSPGRLALLSLKRQSRLPAPPWLPRVNQTEIEIGAAAGGDASRDRAVDRVASRN